MPLGNESGTLRLKAIAVKYWHGELLFDLGTPRHFEVEADRGLPLPLNKG